MNQIYIGENRKICLGSYVPRARQVFIGQGTQRQDPVTIADKLRYSFLSSTNVQILKIEDADPDHYFSDEEV